MSYHFQESAKAEIKTQLDAALEKRVIKGFYALIIDQVEKPLLEMMIETTGGDRPLAARGLGIPLATLQKKLKHHGLI